jgi:hypothetical protein
MQNPLTFVSEVLLLYIYIYISRENEGATLQQKWNFQSMT